MKANIPESPADLEATVQSIKEWSHDLPSPTNRIAYSQAVADGMARVGWAGVNIPIRYGGLGKSHLTRVLMIEAASTVSPSLGAVLKSIQLGTAVPLYSAARNRDYWLQRLALGDDVGSICITEHISGSNLAQMRTVLDEDGHISGDKAFIVNSHVATLHGVVLRDGRVNCGRRLVTALIPASVSGVSSGVDHDLDGLAGVNCGEVKFSRVKTSIDNLDLQSNGMQIGLRAITIFGKLNLASVAIGALSAAIRTVETYLRYGDGSVKRLAKRGVIQKLLGEANACRIQARQLVYSGAMSLDGNSADEMLITTAKMRAGQLAIQGIFHCMEILGARGGMREYGLVGLLNDAIQTLSPAGTSTVALKRLGQNSVNEYRSIF